MTTHRHVRAHLAALASIAVLSACTAKVETAADGGGKVKVAFGSDAAPEATLGPRDVRIVSTNGVLILSLVGDTVRMQLSDSLRNEVSAQIKTSLDSSDESGFGAMIAKSVSKVVNGAMGFVVRVPVADVENLRYEDGRIRFDIRNSDGKIDLNTDSRKNAVFTEADARRFIDAVNAQTRRRTAM